MNMAINSRTRKAEKILADDDKIYFMSLPPPLLLPLEDCSYKALFSVNKHSAVCVRDKSPEGGGYIIINTLFLFEIHSKI